MTWSMSPPCVESCSAPRVAIMRWIGTATETIVSPSSLMRTADCVLPCNAASISGMDLPSTSQRLAAMRRVGPGEQAAQEIRRADRRGRDRSPRRAGRSADGAARGKRARIEQKAAVAVEDAGAGVGRRHEPVQHRPDALGIDRELDRVVVALAAAGALARARAAAACPGRP